MQIVSNGLSLFFGKNKKNITNFSSAELAKRVVKVNFVTKPITVHASS